MTTRDGVDRVDRVEESRHVSRALRLLLIEIGMLSAAAAEACWDNRVASRRIRPDGPGALEGFDDLARNLAAPARQHLAVLEAALRQAGLTFDDRDDETTDEHD